MIKFFLKTNVTIWFNESHYHRLHLHLIYEQYHHIRTTPGPPVFCHPRRLAPERMKIAKAEFEVMVLEGTARRGEGSWASPLHLVPKMSEDWRPCGDYRALNARTIPDHYLVRHIHDYSHRLQGCNIFSVSD
ncbi:uncharacterized protein TNCV_1884201 [Trichonephila clavipes]|nr:uncharacterized protein TNCV_1884201 [Trichonephila clavipes]